MKVIGLAGWSGAGKTTLLKGVIPHFLASGVRISVIKHAHHEFDVDIPGKDFLGAPPVRRYRSAGVVHPAMGPDA